MRSVLLYSRPKTTEPLAEQTINILAEQLQQTGLHVEITHSLNLPRLILNSYQSVHLVIEKLPLTANEAIHFGLCKALGKNTLVSILNSDYNLGKGFLNFVMPDALSVSQTNHFKYYRHISSNKFVLPAFPKHEQNARRTPFKPDAFLIPLNEKPEEAFKFQIKESVYFDGRKLLNRFSSAQIRRKWNDMILSGKLPDNYHLVLSDNKLNEIIEELSLAVVLADTSMNHTEFSFWLGLTLNKKNLIVLNEYQATGFSNFWTSGHNCIVVSVNNWVQSLSHIEFGEQLTASVFRPSEMFQPAVNELSRLYSKLSQQKTTLLTSRSAKL